MMFVQLNNENRIIGTADENCFPEDTTVIEFDFSDDFNFDDQYEYMIIDGKLIASESEDTKKYRTETEKMEAREKFLKEAPDTLSDQDDAICYLYEQLLKEGETNGK